MADTGPRILSPLDLAGRRALVTGASQGLGLASARRLAELGADVLMVSRSEERIRQAAEDVRGVARGQVFALAADIARPEGSAAIERAVAERLGGAEILVVSGGGPKAGGFAEVSDDDWQEAFELLFLSTVRLIRLVLPWMRKRREGSIVVVLSSAVKQPIPHLILSNALRAGVAGLLQSLAAEVAGEGIRVNGVLPGRIDTERVRTLDRLSAERLGVTPEEVRRRAQAAIPTGRYGRPAEFAEAVAFLASPLASYVTGAMLEVDGGLVQTLL